MDYGCQLKDYVISIGEGLGNNENLLTNELLFSPPTEPPEVGSFHRDGKHRVVCKVGKIKVSIGYIDYWTGPLDDPKILGAIIAGSIIVGIIIIIIIVLIVLRKVSGENPYHYIRKKITSTRPNPYIMNNEAPQHTQVINPVPVLNLMDQLKLSNVGLYQNIMSVRIDSERLKQGREIGKGNFGTVFEGIYNCSQGQKKVAIKTLKGNVPDIKAFEEFLEEATIMKDFDHQNVLTLYGVVIIHNKPHVLLPLMELGDLKTYVAKPTSRILVGQLLDYGCQIAEGMSYLASQKFVHRDLAARNCMINSEHVVKIADFGLARDIYEKDYYAVEDKRRPLPVKWMAVECLDSYKFSTKSDVWSYGVTLWELLMRGTKPYPDIDNIDVKRVLLMGRRLSKPAFCPDTIYVLMQDCWLDDPADRPEFSDITKRLKEFFKQVTENESNLSSQSGAISSVQHDKNRTQHNIDQNEYLEMTTDMNATRSYIPMNTIVPSDVPTDSFLNNNREQKGSYVGRYSRDPTANSGYIQPISGDGSPYNNLSSSTRADYTGPYMGIKRDPNGDASNNSDGDASMGYLQPISMSQKEKSEKGKEGSDSDLEKVPLYSGSNL